MTFPLIEKLGIKVWQVFDHRTPEASLYVEAVELETVLRNKPISGDVYSGLMVFGLTVEQIEKLKSYYELNTGKDAGGI